MKVRVFINKQSNFSVDTMKIKKALQKVFADEGIVSAADVSVSIIGERKMIALAKKYLKENGVVHNVLSFPFSETKENFVEPPDNILHLGEIVLCYPKLVEEANKEGKLIDAKAVELAEHAALHLMGKHHE